MGAPTKHTRTDPACRFYRRPRTKWGDRRSRGRSCRPCMVARIYGHRVLTVPLLARFIDGSAA